MPRSETYRVRWGRMGEHWRDFGRFEDALAHYAATPGADVPINLDRYDGAPDGNEYGLTEEQREAVGL